MSTTEMQVKKRIFGAVKRTSRKEDDIVHLLCKCGHSTLLLEREMPFLFEKNNIQDDTAIEKLLLNDCTNCNPDVDHTVSVI